MFYGFLIQFLDYEAMVSHVFGSVEYCRVSLFIKEGIAVDS